MKTLQDLKNLTDQDINELLMEAMSQYVEDTRNALGGKEQTAADLKFVRAIRQKLGI